MIDSIITTLYDARHGYWRTNGARRQDAILCILFADLRVLPEAWKLMQRRYQGRPPLRWDAWADAVDDTYLAGF